MLEAQLKEENSFLTLTYADPNLPLTSGGLPTLIPKHLQDWLKRFRKEILPSRVRFFAVGEYGDETQRPHYHVAMFGYPCCARGNTRYGNAGVPICCDNCVRVHNTWSHGRVFIGDLTVNSAQYVAGYVTKKMTGKSDPRLYGREPEFSRMSRRPGIGVDAMHDVASSLLEFDLEEKMTDVPSVLRHGSRTLPLGRHLRRKLRTMIGRDENAPPEAIEEIKKALQPLRDSAFENSRSFKNEVIDAASVKVKQLESRAKLYKKRGSI